MSDRDRQIIDRIKDASGDKITDTKLAKYIGIKKSTFSGWMKDEKDRLSLDDLGKIYNHLKVTNNTDYQRAAADVLKICNEEFCKSLGEKKSAIISSMMENSAIQFMSSASIAPIIILSKQSNLSSYLPELFSKDSVIKELNLTVAKESTADTIKVIEEWAYGSEGYAKLLQLNLFERECEPIAEMVGGFIEGEFVAVMKHEGYTPMSQLGHELLQEEVDNLADEQPIWSLPHSHEARLIERLRRVLIDTLPPDALAYLADKMQTFEAAEYEDNAAVCNALMASLVTELKDNYGDEVAITVQGALDYFKLAAI